MLKPPRAENLSCGPWLRLAVSLGVSACFLYAFLSYFDFAGVRAALSMSVEMYSALVVAALGASASLMLRAIRWRLLLQTVAPGLSLRSCLAPFLASIAMNNVFPFRLGDVWRLWASSAILGVPASASIASILVEKVLDLLVLLSGATILVSKASNPAIPDALRDVLIYGLISVVMIGVFAVLGPGAVARVLRALIGHVPTLLRPVLDHTIGVLVTLQQIARPGRSAGLLGLSVLIWAAEGLVMVGSLAAVLEPFRPEAAYAATLLATLSTMLPSSPGHVGTFHYFATLGATLYGVAETAAAAAAILTHAIIWLLPTVAGGLAWSMLRRRMPAH